MVSAARRQPGDVVGGGGGCDAVDHAAGKARVVGDPARKAGAQGRGAVKHRVAGHGPVAGKVVAGHHRQPAKPRRPAPVQRRSDDTGRAIGATRGIGLFRHGQRHEPRAGRGHPVQHGAGRLGMDQRLGHDLDHAGRRGVGRQRHGGIGAALRHQQVALGGAGQADRGDAPGARRGPQRIGGTGGHMRAKERPRPQMDDAHRRGRPAAEQPRRRCHSSTPGRNSTICGTKTSTITTSTMARNKGTAARV